jgi:type IV pilus assembly protein PilA
MANIAWKTDRGFTLLEMMVVVLIIAVLVALALPNQTPRIGKGQVDEAVKYCDSLKPTISTYYAINKTFPTSNAVAGLPDPEKLVSTQISKVTIENGVIHITLGNNVIKPLQGQVVSLQPLYVPDSPTSPIDWTCAFSKIPQGMKAAGENKTSIDNTYLPVRCMAMK